MPDSTSDSHYAEASARVHTVLAKLALFADIGTVDEYLALVTEDAIWDFPANPNSGAPASVQHGHAEIRAAVQARRGGGTVGPGSNSQHIVTNVAVDLIGGDTARARSSWLFVTDTLGAKRMSGVGHYDDQFRRVDGVWLLAHRKVSFG